MTPAEPQPTPIPFVRLFLKALPWLLLGLAFVLFGTWVRAQMPFPIGCGRDTEIYSFDFLNYALQLSDYQYIGYGRFRHPLWGWLMSPVPLFGQRLLQFGQGVFWTYLLVIFATFGVLAAMLMRRLLRQCLGLSPLETFACLALYCSFAHVWLLAGMPETFGLSLLLALALLNWAMTPSLRQYGKLDTAGWATLAVLAGGVTSTQGLKALIAYALAGQATIRKLVRSALLLGALALLVVGVFYLRMRLRVSADPNAPGLDAAWQSLFGHIAPASLSLAERLRLVGVFFSEPLILRGEPFDTRVITGGYDSWLQPALLVLMWLVVVSSLWLNRSHLLVRLIAGMFAVDVLIHFVIGWGLTETQLYGGHWMYAPPLLAGLLFGKLAPRARKGYAIALLVLAALYFGCNLHGYFCHDVARLLPPLTA